MYLGDVFTTIANLAGLPSISLNLGFTPEGLPTNVQLLAPRFGDAELLACASVIEKAAGSPEARLRLRYRKSRRLARCGEIRR